jgi:sugar O-acyltransferase (sialic acid O-acetyltransferase NeuD family)
MKPEDLNFRVPKVHKTRNLVILGAGGFAREVFCWVHPEQYQIIGFFTELDGGPNEIFDVQVVRSLEGLPFDTDFVVAVGDPKLRGRLFDQALKTRLPPAMPIIGPHVVVGRDIRIGHGSIVCPGSTLTTNVTIDVGVIVNLHCTIGHDCHLKSFVTLSPGVNLSGNVSVGEGSYIGTNAAVREKLRIGSGSVLGMGAVLTKDLPDGETWTGVPAAKLY